MLTVSDSHIVLGGSGGGGGDVVGAASSTDNAIARFDGATGKVLQNSNVFVSDAGFLGVGTTVPTDFIHVSYNAASSMGVTLQNTNGTGSGYAALLLMTDLGAARRSAILKNSSTTTSYGGANSLFLYQFADDPIAFVVNNNKVPNLYISGNNNVGVNTTDATAKLDVNGTFRSRDSATFNGQIIDNAGSSGADGQVLKKVGGLVLWSNP